MTALVHYHVFPKDPSAHLFEVTCTIINPQPNGQIVSLPAWIPGSYMIRDFAKNVVTISATCGEEPIILEKIDKQTWQAHPCEGPLRIVMEVYAWDLSVRSAHFDTTHAYFNGTSLYLRVHGYDHDVCSIDIDPPKGDAYRNWRLATTLHAINAEPFGFGRFEAADYEEAIDHPVEMGEFTVGRFTACSVDHEIVLTGRHTADMDRLQRDLKQICEYHIKFFGEPAPMSRYQFQTLVVGDGYGGLEHRSSTSLICSRDDLPHPNESKMSDEYRNYLGLCSHEYFHTWMVKRIKPAAFQPYDLTKETHTRLLWAFEGITSYYDELALVRCGMISVDSYLELLGQTITRVLRSKGRFKQSVSDSSFDAWTKFYKQDENGPNSIISYYVKGALVALCLDLKIRKDTKGEKSLDDVMRALWKRYGKRNHGVPERGVMQIAQEVSGLDLDNFFHSALYSTDELPVAEALRTVGVMYQVRPASAQSDKGGKPASGKTPVVALSIKSSRADGGVLVNQVYSGGSAQRGGIAAGDVLIALDGLKLSSDNLDKRLSRYSPGQRVQFTGFRRDELMSFDVELTAPESDTCFLTKSDDNEEATRNRSRWLGADSR